MAQLAELSSRLPFFRAKDIGLNRCIETLEPTLQGTIQDEKSAIKNSGKAYEEICGAELELVKLFERLKRYPACDVARVAKRLWTRQPGSRRGQLRFSLLKEGESSIAFLPELEWEFIIENLFSNASRILKSGDNPSISINVYSRFGNMFVRYKDNGPGFSAELRRTFIR